MEQALINSKIREAFYDWSRFIQADSHILRECPELLFQQAINQPANTEVARNAAAQRERYRQANRSFLRWVNRPESRDPCLMTLSGHTAPVFGISISPDGRRIVSADHSELVIGWDFENGRELFRTRCPDAYRGALVHTPDGKYVITGSDAINVLDSESGRILYRFPAKVILPQSIGLTPDGKRMIWAGEDGALRIWTTGDDADPSTLGKHGQVVRIIACSPDGRQAATSGYDDVMKLWDLQRGIEVWTTKEHTKDIDFLTISQNGKHIVAGSQRGHVEIWDVSNGMHLFTLEHEHGVRAFARMHDGKNIVTSDGMGINLRIWNIENGTSVRTFEKSARFLPHIGCIAVSPDDAHVVTGGADPSLRVWEARTGHEIAVLRGHTEPLQIVLIHPKGEQIVSGGLDHSVRVWDLPKIKGYVGGKNPHGNYVRSVELLARGNRVFSEGDKFIVWDMKRGNILLEVNKSLHKPEVIFTPEGLRIFDFQHQECGMFEALDHPELVRSPKCNVSIWDGETGEMLKTLPAHSGKVKVTAASPNGEWIVSGTQWGVLQIWDTISCLERHTLGKISQAAGKEIMLEGGHSGLRAIAISPDSIFFATGGDDGSIRIWDMRTGEMIDKTPQYLSFAAYRIIIASDGKHLAATSRLSCNPGVLILDIEKAKEVVRLESEWDTWDFAITSDGRCAVLSVLENDYRLELWDLETGRKLSARKGKRGNYWSASFSPDGQGIVFSEEKRLEIWDVRKGTRLGQFFVRAKIHEAPSIDTEFIAFGEEGGGVCILELCDA